MKKVGLKIPVIFVAGIMVGMLITGAASAVTQLQVAAYLDNQISILFNGEEKELPDDMNVIIYNNRTYTPARFIAEELGAEVTWDEVSRSVMVNWEEPEPCEEVVCPPCDESEEEEDTASINYQRLPQRIATADAVIYLTHVDLDTNATWFFFEVEGQSATPIRIDQRSAEMTVEGTTYLQSDIRGVASPLDLIWYTEIEKDESVSGSIKLQSIDEDTENITLKVPYIINDASQTKKSVTFNIRL